MTNQALQLAALLEAARCKAEAMGVDPDRIVRRAIFEAATDPEHTVAWWLDENLRQAEKQPDDWRTLDASR